MPRKAIEPDDFLKYKMLSHPDFSPDGSKIAFSVHQGNKEDNLYDGDVVITETNGSGSIRFSYGGKDSSPKFSPDGKTLLFLSKRTLEKDEKGSELYIMSLPAGQARRLLKRKEGIGNPEWSHDSNLIYFTSKVLDKQDEEDEDKDGVKVIRRRKVWFNGEGFVHNSRNHLFSINVESGNVAQITSGEFDVAGYHISNDGKKVGHLASMDETRPYITDLFIIDSNGTIKVTKSDMQIVDFAWSSDDRQIALNGAYYIPRGLASNSHIYIAEPKKESELKKIEDVDLEKENALNSDSRSSAHGSGSIYWKNDYIYYLEEHGGSVFLNKIKQGSQPQLVIGEEASIEDYNVSKDDKVAFVMMDSTHLSELNVLSDGSTKQLTHLNDSVYEELDIAKQEYFTLDASDGAIIDSWILTKDRSKKLPTILYIHGGPKTSFGNSYMHEFQTFASKGYAVLFANIRGSNGYSEEFADLRGHYGERDYKDLLEVVEYAAQKYPFIDKDRMGVAGGSYGGFMTNWIVGHSDLFKAAVSDRSIASWESFFGTSDIGTYFTKDQIGTDPFEGRIDLQRMSPITYAKNVKTPVLIVHSMEDYRCWMVEGLQFYTALKYLGKDVEMVLFPEENHDLSRIGKPRRRISRLNHYLRWFDKYLKS